MDIALAVMSAIEGAAAVAVVASAAMPVLLRVPLAFVMAVNIFGSLLWLIIGAQHWGWLNRGSGYMVGVVVAAVVVAWRRCGKWAG